MSGFVPRQISATITLAASSSPNTFGNGANTATLAGLRMAATIQQAGNVSIGMMQLRVWGMTLKMINQLTTLGGNYLQQINNTISVQAGDSINGMSTAFQGVIKEAYPDMMGAPDPSFVINAYGALYGATAAIAPSSYRGSASVAVIMANLAAAAGLQFENSGVNVQLSNPYFSGDAKTQIAACARAAGIYAAVDEKTNTLAIWPADGSRGGAVPVISPSAGMIGYPCFQSNRVIVQKIYDPTIRYGAQVQIQSSLTPACGMFTVYGLVHDLEALMPGGRWQSTITAFPVSALAPTAV